MSLLLIARGSAVLHCTGRKDRTGLATAMLLSCLGVDRETVVEDHRLTSALSGHRGTFPPSCVFEISRLGPSAREGLGQTSQRFDGIIAQPSRT